MPLALSRLGAGYAALAHTQPPHGALTLSAIRMKIRVDSDEYKCWHEVGHATVCLHLGGDVDFIEFLVGDARGHARARCVVIPEIERMWRAVGLLLSSTY